jgi:DNA-binding CsgD family transcriptional regulator
VEGLQNKEIAHRLNVFPKTVEFHKTQLLREDWRHRRRRSRPFRD